MMGLLDIYHHGKRYPQWPLNISPLAQLGLHLLVPGIIYVEEREEAYKNNITFAPYVH